MSAISRTLVDEAAAVTRVPRASLAVHGRRGQYLNTAPEGRVPRAASGGGGGRLRRPGADAGEGRAWSRNRSFTEVGLDHARVRLHLGRSPLGDLLAVLED